MPRWLPLPTKRTPSTWNTLARHHHLAWCSCGVSICSDLSGRTCSRSSALLPQAADVPEVAAGGGHQTCAARVSRASEFARPDDVPPCKRARLLRCLCHDSVFLLLGCNGVQGCGSLPIARPLRHNSTLLPLLRPSGRIA